MADTIYALSSGNLPSGIAVIRLSGPHVRFGLEIICGLVPEPRLMQCTAFRDTDGLVIDRGLCVFFPAPRSFTGEDSAELHLHGSRATVRKCMEVLDSLAGFRVAEAGEFSKRAFMNGKMDLTAAEGLADLIAAETETQRKLALALANGGLNRLYGEWRSEIIRIRAMLEASIEFSEEDDVAVRALHSVEINIGRLADAIQEHVADAKYGEIIRDGFQVAIVGAPNAGKSSLLNALARRDVAIATDEPGTTRDVIEVRLDLGGHLVVLADTAGLRIATNKVEKLGIERTIERSKKADLILAVYNAAEPVSFELEEVSAQIVRIGSHSDLLKDGSDGGYELLYSAVTGEGVNKLIALIEGMASSALSGANLAPVRDRQVGLLNEAIRQLVLGRSRLVSNPEFAAEDLRVAGDAIGRLTGVVDVEDLLDVVFGSFCIGK